MVVIAIDYGEKKIGFAVGNTETMTSSPISIVKKGKTGFPLVDASMRCVVKTGYLNFRMRALLVSFLTHHLWQNWQDGVVHLAKNF